MIPQVVHELRRIDVETGDVTVVATRQVDAPYPVRPDDAGGFYIFRHGENVIPVASANDLETAVHLWAGTLQDMDRLRAENERLRKDAEHWKANHDHQVQLKNKISQKYGELLKERNGQPTPGEV